MPKTYLLATEYDRFQKELEETESK